jgi:hypothetical protein
LLGSSFQQRTFLFLWVPELSPASGTTFSLLTTATLKRERERERKKLGR